MTAGMDILGIRFASRSVQLAGIVAAGAPLEPFPQTEFVEIPANMASCRESFALRIKGESMRNDGILPGDIVIVEKQATARNGQTVIALLNGEATIKTYFRKAGAIELHPANETMPSIVVHEADAFRIEGLVIGLIRHLSR